jgi:hypothetical protein
MLIARKQLRCQTARSISALHLTASVKDLQPYDVLGKVGSTHQNLFPHVKIDFLLMPYIPDVVAWRQATRQFGFIQPIKIYIETVSFKNYA